MMRSLASLARGEFFVGEGKGRSKRKRRRRGAAMARGRGAWGGIFGDEGHLCSTCR